MSRPSFTEGVTVALVLAIVAGLIFSLTSFLFSTADAIRMVITLTSAIYGAYLLTRSQEPSGYLLLFVLWALGIGALVVVNPGVVIYSAVHLGLIWLTRALYHCTGPLQAICDLSLHSAAFVMAIWGAAQTNSVLVTTWCLFLVLAAFVWLPGRSHEHAEHDHLDHDDAFDDVYDDVAFDHALATAQSAAKKLASVS